MFLPCQFSGREGVSRVLGLGGGWEREEGSSAFLRLVLPLDLGVDEACSVLVSPQLKGGATKSQEAQRKPPGPPYGSLQGWMSGESRLVKH